MLTLPTSETVALATVEFGAGLPVGASAEGVPAGVVTAVADANDGDASGTGEGTSDACGRRGLSEGDAVAVTSFSGGNMFLPGSEEEGDGEGGPASGDGVGGGGEESGMAGCWLADADASVVGDATGCPPAPLADVSLPLAVPFLLPPAVLGSGPGVAEEVEAGATGGVGSGSKRRPCWL